MPPPPPTASVLRSLAKAELGVFLNIVCALSAGETGALQSRDKGGSEQTISADENPWRPPDASIDPRPLGGSGRHPLPTSTQCATKARRKEEAGKMDAFERGAPPRSFEAWSSHLRRSKKAVFPAVKTVRAESSER